MLDYSALNHLVLNKVPSYALTILDVGCGTGIMGKALKSENSARKVDGITYSQSEFDAASKLLDNVWVADINERAPGIDTVYDCIIFSHILEHTFNPSQVLKNFSGFLKENGIVIIALPNVLQYKQRLEFMKGNFKYSLQGGLMDATHFRFFDWQSAQEMINDASLRIIDKKAGGHFPLFFFRRFLPDISRSIDRFSLKHWPGLFAFQFVFVAVKSTGQSRK